MPRRRRESTIAGHERNAEDLRERDEGRVVRGEVVPQLPHPIGKWLMRISDDREIVEVRPDVRGPVFGHMASSHEPPEGMDDLHVDQMRGVEIAILRQSPAKSRRARATREGGQDGRGVDDDHVRSRPERTDATILVVDVPPDLAEARARTSATGGRSATRVTSARRYSVRERPAAAARARRARWTPSGTLRIWIDRLMSGTIHASRMSSMRDACNRRSRRP